VGVLAVYVGKRGDISEGRIELKKEKKESGRDAVSQHWEKQHKTGRREEETVSEEPILGRAAYPALDFWIERERKYDQENGNPKRKSPPATHIAKEGRLSPGLRRHRGEGGKSP